MKVVVRSLAALRVLARSPRGIALSELTHELDLPLATTHRILATLCDEGFATRSSSNKRYFLGPAAREVGQATQRRSSPLQSTHASLKAAADSTGETVFVCELVGNEAVCLSLEESRHPLRLFVRSGQAMPLHAAASARVLLAWEDEDVVTRILGQAPFTRYTDRSPRHPADVIRHLAVVREQGYDVSESELDDGVWAVSAPVRDSTGAVVASVTVAAPLHRVADEPRRAELLDSTLTAALGLSADLGWEPTP